MQNSPIFICWFRQDLRLSDNPAFYHAVQAGNVLPVYILDDESAAQNRMGGASRWWLHYSLHALNKSLNGKLQCYHGKADEILLKLVTRYKAKAVYWNRCYEPWRIQRDTELRSALEQKEVRVKSYNGSLLWEPWEINKDNGTPYKVFTPFYRRGCLNSTPPHEPLPTPSRLTLVENEDDGHSIDALNLLPAIRWDKQLEPHWNIGEKAAQQRLQVFVDEELNGYKNGRNFPAMAHVSRLSPSLHFGEVSPNQVWYAAQAKGEGADIEHFCSELAWREFSYHLLYRHPDLPDRNLQSSFDVFPWREDEDALRCWQKGQTGYPIVDAGMRELWQTGYMHNRVRMIVGSFLVKNLLLHWKHGERWFWDCLVDADLANNSASWQWVGGSGADAAPYFRIFNPVTQGVKFDPEGEYTRRYVPELAALPDKYLFNPWDAPQTVLQEAGIVLGKTYPKPIVELKFSRERALRAFHSTKEVKE